MADLDAAEDCLHWAAAFRDRIVPRSAYTAQSSSSSITVLFPAGEERVAQHAAHSKTTFGKFFLVTDVQSLASGEDAVVRLDGESVAGVPLPRVEAGSPPAEALNGLCFLIFPQCADGVARDEGALLRVVAELRRRLQPRCVAVWARRQAAGPGDEGNPLLHADCMRRIAAGTAAAHWEASAALGLFALAWGAGDATAGAAVPPQDTTATADDAALSQGPVPAVPQRHDDGSPTVVAGSQFGDLYARAHAPGASNGERSLWTRLRALIASRVRGSAWATEHLMGVVEPMSRQQAAALASPDRSPAGDVPRDADIYAALAAAFHDCVRVDPRYKPQKTDAGGNGADVGAQPSRKRPHPGSAPGQPEQKSAKAKPRRQDHLVRKAMRAFPGRGRFHARSLLDVGCAEGNVTAELGRQLDVPRASLHGCDVRAVAAEEQSGFEFRQYDGQSLPYADASFEVASAFMVLHHVRHAPRVVAEVARVLQPGGHFLIREHDCALRGLPVLLDIMHGLYALVWKRPSEWPLFLAEYEAYYKSKEDWDAMMRAAGLTRVRGQADWLYREGSESLAQPADSGNLRNAAAAYFAVYRKAGGRERGDRGDRGRDDRHDGHWGRQRRRRRGDRGRKD